jgi:hypothetical protein
MSPLPNTYVILENVTRFPATYREFVETLKHFSRSDLLRMCCVMNLKLARGSVGYDTEAHALLVREYFKPDLAEKMIASGRPVFHRHQLLFIAQEALRHCEDVEQRPESPPPLDRIGTLMLMASQLLAVRRPKEAAQNLELARRICSVLPDMETNGPLGYHRRMARSLAMCTRFVEPFRGTKKFFDVHELFFSSTGIRLETFFALLFGCFSRFLRLDEVKKSTDLSDFGIATDFFRTCTAITPKTLAKFFAHVSADAKLFADEVQKKDPHHNEFTVLRNRPLFATNGFFLPIDLSLLADKMESGIFWSVNSQVPSDRRRHFHEFWGDVFERYFAWLMSSSVNGTANKFFADPRYVSAENPQVCDGIVVSGRSAVLIECKGSTFTAKGKYGLNPGVLDAELQEKLVGTPKRRKGVYQLFDAVVKLCTKDSSHAIRDIDMRDIDTVIPLILTRDDIGAAFNTSAYLNFQFQELLKGFEPERSVLPLSCISVDDLERLAPYLNDTALSDVIRGRIESERSLVSPLWAGDNKVLETLYGRPDPLFNAELEKLEEICRLELGLLA